MSTKLNVRAYNNKELLLFPASIGDFLPKEHIAHVVDEVVEQLDLTAYYNKISNVGNPSYHPLMMIKIWFYAYVTKTYSSRKIEEKLYTDVAFIYLAGMQKPDFKTISEFRRKYAEELRNSFVEIVEICHRLGMIDLDVISLDSKVTKANASASRTYTEDELIKEQQEIEKAIKKFLDKANQIDDEEDKKYGPDKRSYELLEDIRDKEQRIKKLKQIVEQLKQARQKLKQDNKRKINLTDNDAQFQKDKTKKVIGYRCHIAVDAKQQIIVANDVTEKQADQDQLLPMVNQVIEVADKIKQTDKQSLIDNTSSNIAQEESKIKVVADSGYSSGSNLKELQKYEDKIDAYIPDQTYQAKIRNKKISPFEKDNFVYDETTDEFICPLGNKLHYFSSKRKNGQTIKIYRCNNSKNCKYFAQCTTSLRGRIIEVYENEHLIKQMRQKLSTEEAKKIYIIRKITAEPVLGNISHNLCFKEFLLRGIKKVKTEFSLICTAHNLLKIAKFIKELGVTLKEALAMLTLSTAFNTS